MALFVTMTKTIGAHQSYVSESECGTMQALYLMGRPKPPRAMRFETAPQPKPNWDRPQEPEVAAEMVTGCEATKRELDEYAKSKIEEAQ